MTRWRVVLGEAAVALALLAALAAAVWVAA